MVTVNAGTGKSGRPLLCQFPPLSVDMKTPPVSAPAYAVPAESTARTLAVSMEIGRCDWVHPLPSLLIM